jgi:hypothetical protein
LILLPFLATVILEKLLWLELGGCLMLEMETRDKAGVNKAVLIFIVM